jgi:hypothetical protein
MKKPGDLDPLDRELVNDATRLLLPLFIVSSVPSSKAKEPSLQAGDLRLATFLVSIQTC